MNDDRRARIDQVATYRDDLLRFGEMLVANHRPPEFSALRQDILRRGGSIRPLCERVLGTYAYPQTTIFGRTGPDINVWDLALRPSGHFDTPAQQAKFGEGVADLLTELIGRLEADPSLLEPPPPPAPRPEGAQTINIHGGNVNIGQTFSGDVTQTNTFGADLASVRQLLADLERAIGELEAPEEERESMLAPVETARAELRQARPIVGRLLAAYGAIQVFATAESTWQGWERVQHIAGELAPQLHKLIEATTR